MTDTLDFLTRQDPAHVGALLLRTGVTLGMPHAEVAKVLGVSRRTVSRWGKDGTRLPHHTLVTLAELAHTRDPSLAAEIARVAGETLVSLGLEEPAPLPAHPAAIAALQVSPKLIDAVVCAAAESLDMSPRAVRPALLAAVQCAREVGLSLDGMEGMLSAAVEGRRHEP
jgi:hypothetical protein